MRPRLLLLCLEGLSRTQAQWLFGNLGSLDRLSKQGELSALAHRPVVSFQPVWAEILWGKPWFELGISGYGRPRASLNEVTALSERDCPLPCKLLDSHKSVLVNLPLMTPNENRFWLSDGSLPIGTIVSPSELERCPSVNDYKPRPFSSVALGAARLEEAVADSLQVEMVRLKCADEIMRTVDWHISLVRVTAFDLLFHLLGVEFLQERDALWHNQIQHFLSTLDSWMNGVLNAFPEAFLCLMSTLGHRRGIARVNLNEILYRGGFCEPASEQPDTDENQRRIAASLMLKKSDLKESGGDEPQTLALTPSWKFNLSGTICGSAVQGGIFLNLKERYQDGTVESSEASGLLTAVRHYVVEALRRELGVEPDVWQCEQIGPTGPEFMIHAEGVEFHNSCHAPAVDTVNKPRSTHTSEGFIWLPRGMSSNAEVVTPLQLHELLSLVSGQEASCSYG